MKKTLKWWDIGILTIIMLGPSLLLSLLIFINRDKVILPEGDIVSSDTIYAILIQLFQLIAAFFYLRITQFDFSQWKCRLTIRATILAFLLYFGLGLTNDIVSCIGAGSWDVIPHTSIVENLFHLPLVYSVYAIMNGFYTEFFYLGICTTVADKYKMYGFLYSIFIRIMIHLHTASFKVAISGVILGSIYYYIYKKNEKNIYPLALTHAIISLLGLSFIQFF